MRVTGSERTDGKHDRRADPVAPHSADKDVDLGAQMVEYGLLIGGIALVAAAAVAAFGGRVAALYDVFL
jgi:Flp pilus assembly pilin Flp